MKEENPFQEIKNTVIQVAKQTADLQRMNDFKSTIINDTQAIVYITGLEDNGDWKRDDIIWMNDHAMQQFGNRIGGKCYEVFQNLHDSCEFCTNPQILKNPGKPIKWIYFNKKLNKLFFLIDVMTVVNGKKFRIEVAHDITDQAAEIVNLYNTEFNE